MEPERPGKVDENCRHVICFDDLPVESDYLNMEKLEDGSNVFREQFDQIGVFTYKC